MASRSFHIVYEYDPANRFRLLSRGGVGNYEYDFTGNLKAETAGTYQYNSSNRLESATIDGVTSRYVYDAQGWRLRKVVNQGPPSYYTRAASGELLSEWVNTSPTTATARDYVYAGSVMLSVINTINLTPK